MTGLFLYDNGPRADVVFHRPLIRQLDLTGTFDLVVAVCSTDHDLVVDLTSRGVRVILSDYPNTWRGVSLGLEYLCPQDFIPIELARSRYDDTLACSWENHVEVFNRQMEENGIEFAIEFDELSVPMIGLSGGELATRVRRPSLYVDNDRQSFRLARFLFDFERLAEVFSGFDIFHTYPQDVVADNLIDCSHLSLQERASLSDHCNVLLGSTPYPFVATLTEANRFKPKAVCGYEAFTYPSFWDYPQNPLEYLGTMDEVVDFLLANLWDCTALKVDSTCLV